MRLTASHVMAAASSVFTTLFLGPAVGHAAGDPAVGQREFAICARCHSISPGVNERGPSLAAVVGRKSGAAVGYKYSAAKAIANVIWDDTNLDRFLAGPRRFVPGTRMSVSVPSGADRQNLIAYLDTLK
jgi:cytochrome c